MLNTWRQKLYLVRSFFMLLVVIGVYLSLRGITFIGIFMSIVGVLLIITAEITIQSRCEVKSSEDRIVEVVNLAGMTIDGENIRLVCDTGGVPSYRDCKVSDIKLYPIIHAGAKPHLKVMQEVGYVTKYYDEYPVTKTLEGAKGPKVYHIYLPPSQLNRVRARRQL